MQTFSFSLNKSDRKIIRRIARKRGYANEHELIRELLNKLPTQIDLQKIPCAKQKKSKSIFELPTEHEDFYNQLSCYHSTPVSAVISRYILFPLLTEEILSNK